MGEECEQSHPIKRRIDQRTSVEILEDEENSSPDGRPLETDIETSVQTASRPSSSHSQQRPLSFKLKTSGRPSTSNSKRPKSQSSSRSRALTQKRPSTSQERIADKVVDVAVHRGRPIDFSRALAGAYMGAASNDNVRALLSKTSQS